MTNTDARCRCCPVLSAIRVGSRLVCISAHPEIPASLGSTVGRRSNPPSLPAATVGTVACVGCAAPRSDGFFCADCAAEIGVSVSKLEGKWVRDSKYATTFLAAAENLIHVSADSSSDISVNPSASVGA